MPTLNNQKQTERTVAKSLKALNTQNQPERKFELITQRSKVQILPPQPIKSIT
jgi:hypothetical protein